MRKLIENLFTTIIVLLIIIIASGTIYFCLDVFGVIQVPDEYSIASLFNTQIEVLANGDDYTDTITDKINTNEVGNKIVYKKKKKVSENIPTEPTKTVEEINAEFEKAYADKTDTQEVEQGETQEHAINLNTAGANSLYYMQLDSYGKQIYEEMFRNKLQMKSGLYTADFGDKFNDLLHTDYGSDTLNSAFQYSINALTFDNPEIFYVDVTKLYLLTEITTRAFSKSYKVSIGVNEENYLSDEFPTEDDVNRAVNKIESVRSELVKACQGKTQPEQIKIVHDYLLDTVEYDKSNGSTVYNAYGALINRRAVCEGYARAFKYVLDELKIPCVIVCGIAENRDGQRESHAWNYVYLKGEWYAIDVTWDDPIITGYGRPGDDIKYAYFLKGSDEFFEDHFEDGNIVSDSEFKYPTISKTNFDY